MLAVNKITNENPEELRRFLCWITGGTWVQIGPARSCIYPKPGTFGEEGSIGGVEVTSWIRKAIFEDKQINDVYYMSKKISEEELSSEIQKILTSEGADAEIQGFSFRRFICRILGGTWQSSSVTQTELIGELGLSSSPNITYTTSYDMCVY